MKAMLLEPLLAMDIIFLLSWFSMVATVDFNNKTSIKRSKVCNIRTYYILTQKFNPKSITFELIP